MKFLFAFLSVAALSGVRGHPSGIHQQHQISVPDYHPQLQNLGQHVDLPHIPTKVIRITKTVAIKVPVPYPVKVPHRVPYPVQVNKPYPVHVPQIIKVPHPYPVPVESNSHGQDYSSGGQSYEGQSYGGGYAGDQGAGGYSSYSPSDSYEHAASQHTESQLAQQYVEPGNTHAQESYQVAQVAPSAGAYGHQQLGASQQTVQGYHEGPQAQGGHYQQQEHGSYAH